MQIANYMWHAASGERQAHLQLISVRSAADSHLPPSLTPFSFVHTRKTFRFPFRFSFGPRHRKAACNRKSMRSHATSKASPSMRATCSCASTSMTSASLARAKCSSCAAARTSWALPACGARVGCVPQFWRSRTTVTISV